MAAQLPVAQRVIIPRETLGPITDVDNLAADAPYNTTVRRITINRNQLTECPPLPQQATHVKIRENLITQLQPLPPTLLQLDVEENRISVFPNLPATVVACKIQRNQLTQVPSLAHCVNLTSLGLSHNQLTSIEAFPPNVVNIGITFNPTLQRIPPLPPSARVLSALGAGLREPPRLNDGLETCVLKNNQLTEIPNIPASIHCFDVTGCPLSPPYQAIIAQVNQEFPQPPNPLALPGHVNGLFYGGEAQRLRELVNHYNDVLNAQSKARNLAGFRQTMGNLRPPNNTPANWYYGRSVNPAPELLADEGPGPGNYLASLITGLPGTQKQQALQLREKISRPLGGPGVGGRRTRRKARRSASRQTRK